MITTLLTVALSLSVSCASNIPSNYKRDSGILSLPITVLESATSSVANVRRRQKTAVIDNIGPGTLYLIQLSVGTPPQAQSLIIDTASNFNWVNPQCDTSGEPGNVALCNSLPRYDQSQSPSSVDLELEGTLAYTKGEAYLHFYNDTFLVGGATVNEVMFGVALSSQDIPAGILGVAPGFEYTEYPNLIDTLAKTGVTQSRAFSLDLRGVESAAGALIFGGIDTNKYIGKLEKIPIIPAAQTPDESGLYWINMGSVSITKPGQCEKKYSSVGPQGQPVYLDSAGTISHLPSALVNAIVADFPGATLDSNTGLYAVDCSVATQPGTVNFGFGATTIRVPYKDFIWQTQGVCYIGVVASSTIFVLGDTFLRAAYVVFDQENKNVFLAQAANCGTNLVAIGTGPDAVPSVTGGCSVPSATSSACSSTSTSMTSTSSTSSTITSSSSSSSSTAASSSSIQTSSLSTTGSSSSSSTVASSSSIQASSSLTSGSSTITVSSGSSSSTTPVTSSTPSSVPTYTNSSISSTVSSSLSSSKPVTLTTSSSTGSSSTGSSSTGVSTSQTSLTSQSTSKPSSSSTVAPYPTTNGTVSFPSTTLTSSSSTLATATPTGPTTTPGGTGGNGGVSSTNTNLPTTIATGTSTTPGGNGGSASQTDLTTSTVYSTSVYTVTSCAPTVTNCPALIGHVTTEVVIAYVTICPVTAINLPPAVTPAPAPPGGVSTVYTTLVLTITSCPPSVQNCPYGSVTTTVVPLYTPQVPQIQTVTKVISSTDIIYKTTTYTVTQCPATVNNCPYGSVTTATVPVSSTVRVFTTTVYIQAPSTPTKSIIPGSPEIIPVTGVPPPPGSKVTVIGSDTTTIRVPDVVVPTNIPSAIETTVKVTSHVVALPSATLVVGAPKVTPASTTAPLTVSSQGGSGSLMVTSSLLFSAIALGLLAVL